MVKEKKAKTRKKVSYAKWGYIFLIPFYILTDPADQYIL